MKHIFQSGSSTGPTILILHGSGGTEKDFLEAGKLIDPGANILSVRGNVVEDGMHRYFARLTDGSIDEKDLIFRTQQLHQFLEESAGRYNFDLHQVLVFGYSNGATMGASLLFHYARSVTRAFLHHPMVPRRDVPLPSLSGSHIFIGAGTNDPVCLPGEAEVLYRLFEEAGACVELYWEHEGHQLTTEEIKAGAAWYQRVTQE